MHERGGVYFEKIETLQNITCEISHGEKKLNQDEEVLVAESQRSSAGICKGLQWGWKKKGECRFEQELGCYANWKDNNRLSEDGCADGLADEHKHILQPPPPPSLSPHLDNTDPSPHLIYSIAPFRFPSREII